MKKEDFVDNATLISFAKKVIEICRLSKKEVEGLINGEVLTCVDCDCLFTVLEQFCPNCGENAELSREACEACEEEIQYED